jgi:hypothetical protein
MKDVAEILRQFGMCKGERAGLEDHWRDCYRYSFPQLGTGFAGVASTDQQQAERALLLDSTSTDSVRTLASTLCSGIAPANSQWINMAANGEDNDNNNRWLSECSELLWQNLANSNFDAEFFNAMLEAVISGAYVLYLEAKPTGGFVFQQWPAYECYWSSSTNSLTDTIYREYCLTAAQVYREFGDKTPDSIQEKLRTEPDFKYDFLHVVRPRDVYQPGGKLSRNLPFASYHICVPEKAILRESGYEEFPCSVPRLMRIPGSPYATGPMSDALPDIKELNVLKKYEKQAAELAVSGMWVATDDGVLNARNLKIGPRKIIVAADVANIKPLSTGSDFNVAFTCEERLQAQIRRVLMADQLNGAKANMTATEVQERMALIRQQMGPMYGRLMSEGLTPMVERAFGLMYRSGAFPPPPDDMSGVNFHVQFDSPLSRAQRLGEVAAIGQLSNYVLGMLQAFPEVGEVFDASASTRDMAQSLGVTAKLLRSEDTIKQIRAAQAQAAQQAQQEQMSQQLQMQNASEQITNANTSQVA